MKLKLIFLFVIIIAACFSSCSKNENIREGFCRGMYEMGNQQMKRVDEEPWESDRELPSYDQYKRERQEILTGSENDHSQLIKIEQ